jgi:hypothetical protein
VVIEKGKEVCSKCEGQGGWLIDVICYGNEHDTQAVICDACDGTGYKKE